VLVSLHTWRWKQQVLPKLFNLSTKLQTTLISSLSAPRHVIPSLCHWLSFQSVLHLYLKMDLPNPNEILVAFYQATWHHILEDRSLHCSTAQQLVSDQCPRITRILRNKSRGKAECKLTDRAGWVGGESIGPLRHMSVIPSASLPFISCHRIFVRNVSGHLPDYTASDLWHPLTSWLGYTSTLMI
jgi:hypothetical protein